MLLENARARRCGKNTYVYHQFAHRCHFRVRYHDMLGILGGRGDVQRISLNRRAGPHAKRHPVGRPNHPWWKSDQCPCQPFQGEWHSRGLRWRRVQLSDSRAQRLHDRQRVTAPSHQWCLHRFRGRRDELRRQAQIEPGQLSDDVIQRSRPVKPSPARCRSTRAPRPSSACRPCPASGRYRSRARWPCAPWGCPS